MSHIRAIALKSFPYSEDGYTLKTVSIHEVFDCPQKIFDGLNSIGWVRREQIGDGHFSLRPDPVAQEPVVADETVIIEDTVVDEAPEDKPEEPLVDNSDVEIPDDWQSLKFFALRSIANKVSQSPIKTQEDAVAAIQSELARRG